MTNEERVWRLARKILCEIDAEDLKNIFGYYDGILVIDNFTHKEVLDRLNDYNKLKRIKSCPFCGGKKFAFMDSGNDSFQVRVVCDVIKDGCGASSGYCKSKDEAIEAWNSRV